MSEIVPSTSWDEVAAEILRERGVTMVLGDVDAGKSSLVRYLSRKTTEYRPVSVVDADVGQSSLCIPGTVSSALLTAPRDAEIYRCDAFAFIGTANPAYAFKQIIEATALFVGEGRKNGGTVIVDTGGLVTGPIGTGLKLAKIRLLQPDRVIVIQRGEECEPILQQLDEVRVFRLAPSPHVAPRTREVRAQYRLMRMKQFLEEGEQVEHLLPEGLEFLCLGRPVSLRHLELTNGTLLGLNHGNLTLDIGVVTEGGSSPLVRCRLKLLEGITRIVFGDLTIAEPVPGG